MTVKSRVPRRRRKVDRSGYSSGASILGPISLAPDSSWLSGGDLQAQDVPRPFSSHAWVYACTRSISMNIAGVPVRVLSGSEADPVEHRDDPDLIDVGSQLASLFARPNAHMTSYQLWEVTVALMNLDGMAVWILDRETVVDVPREIYVVRKLCMTPVYADPTNRSPFSIIGWKYRLEGGTEEVPLTLAQVIPHFKFFNPYHPLWGLSPLEAARRGVRLDLLASIYSERFFGNSAVPEGLLIAERAINKEMREQMLSEFEARHRGFGNARRVGMLSGGVKWQSISPSHEEMQFVEQKKMTVDELCAVFGVPKTELGITEGMNYASSLSADARFWKKTLVPTIRNVQAVVNMDLVRPLRSLGDKTLRIIFDLVQVPALQEEFSYKLKDALTLYRLGYTPNQINERLGLGLPKLDWGDTALVNSALVPIDVLVADGGVQGGKPFHPAVPGPNEPPEDEEDDVPDGGSEDDEEPEGGSEPINPGDRYPSLSTTSRRRRCNKLQPLSSPPPSVPSALKGFAVQLRDALRAHIRRLRAHQLALASRGIKDLFDQDTWDEKLRRRVAGIIEKITSTAKLTNQEDPIQGLKAIHSFIRKDLETFCASASSLEQVERVRRVFSQAAGRTSLQRLAHLEVGRILGLKERTGRNGSHRS